MAVPQKWLIDKSLEPFDRTGIVFCGPYARRQPSLAADCLFVLQMLDSTRGKFAGPSGPDMKTEQFAEEHRQDGIAIPWSSFGVYAATLIFLVFAWPR